MSQYSASWSAKKQQKKAQFAGQFLHPGESIIFYGTANSFKPLAIEIVVTNARILRLTTTGVAGTIANRDIADVQVGSTSIVITTLAGDTVKFSSISKKETPEIAAGLEAARTAQAPAETTAAVDAAIAAAEEADRVSSLTFTQRWPSVVYVGAPSGKAYRAIQDLCHEGESPWLIIVPGGGAGLVVAFADRLAIIKTGGMSGFMSGALFGGRNTTFYFTDINALEYNSGMVNGVLEVLTASYQGTANKDFWRGSTQSRNANSNDPYTLSNTLPLPKLVYAQAAPHLQQLRSRISSAKQGIFFTETGEQVPAASAQQTTQANPDGLVEQLERLSKLRDAGVLTEEEFAASKARLISS